MQDAAVCTFLAHEAQALLARLSRIRPFVLSETMVPAASPPQATLQAIEQHLAQGRRQMRQQVRQFIAELAHGLPPALAQRRFVLLRLRFTAVLTQLDLFADALAQRSDRDLGVWMAGLDALAADTLAQPRLYAAPPLLCYLDRGIGAAIRRARTRLPGGGDNPAAIIRVPRERMVGAGIAGSLVHEVGHQAAALLGLVASLREQLGRLAAANSPEAPLWRAWERWVSEIVADLWSVARLGPAATLGMIGVLSLPRAFVFRLSTEDPHPPPWLRVQISAAIGAALYPGLGWHTLQRLWLALYPLHHPLHGQPARQQPLLRALAAAVPALVRLLLAHRGPGLQGQTLHAVAHDAALAPAALEHTLQRCRHQPARLLTLRPAVACAALGLARVQQRISPEAESRWMARLLTHWALRPVLAPPPPPPLLRPLLPPLLSAAATT
jgi:hypothetical protein